MRRLGRDVLVMNSKKKNVRGLLSRRSSKFTMLLSKDEHVQLHELAGREGVPASVYLRMLIRSEAATMRTNGGSGRKSNGAT